MRTIIDERQTFTLVQALQQASVYSAGTVVRLERSRGGYLETAATIISLQRFTKEATPYFLTLSKQASEWTNSDKHKLAMQDGKNAYLIQVFDEELRLYYRND